MHSLDGDDEDDEDDDVDDELDEDEESETSSSILGSPVSPPPAQSPVKSSSGKMSYKSTFRKMSNYFRSSSSANKDKDRDRDNHNDMDASVRRKLFRSMSYAAVSPSSPIESPVRRTSRHSSNYPVQHGSDSNKLPKKDAMDEPSSVHRSSGNGTPRPH